VILRICDVITFVRDKHQQTLARVYGILEIWCVEQCINKLFVVFIVAVFQRYNVLVFFIKLVDDDGDDVDKMKICCSFALHQISECVYVLRACR